MSRWCVYIEYRNILLTHDEFQLIGFGHGLNTEANRNKTVEIVDAFEYCLFKNESFEEKQWPKWLNLIWYNYYLNSNKSNPLDLRKLSATYKKTNLL